jgi:hypothetical protein
MGNYEIKVKVEIVESSTQNENGVKEKNDGSFTMVINEEDAFSIDHSEQALLTTAYPSLRKALAEHLEKVSKKKALQKPKGKKY